jgi:transposase
MLTAVRVPSPAEEAVRDLVRARGDLLDDRKRMQQRLNAFLLRYGRTWREGAKWTYAHRAWVDRQRFGEPALQEALDAYRGALEAREAESAPPRPGCRPGPGGSRWRRRWRSWAPTGASGS